MPCISVSKDSANPYHVEWPSMQTEAPSTLATIRKWQQIWHLSPKTATVTENGDSHPKRGLLPFSASNISTLTTKTATVAKLASHRIRRQLGGNNRPNSATVVTSVDRAWGTVTLVVRVLNLALSHGFLTTPTHNRSLCRLSLNVAILIYLLTDWFMLQKIYFWSVA